jgi:hypothetical protein
MSTSTDRRYVITWTEISNHRRDLTAAELATILNTTVAELSTVDVDELASELPDALAELDDSGLLGLTREDIHVVTEEGTTAAGQRVVDNDRWLARERLLIEHGRCAYQTGYGLPGMTYCQTRTAGPGVPFCGEHTAVASTLERRMRGDQS